MATEQDATLDAIQIQIVIPVFNDGESLAKLLPLLDKALADQQMSAGIVVVDDGSTQPLNPQRPAGRGEAGIVALRTIRLKRNMGHQRAIAIGLCFAQAHLSPEVTGVMDSDGEDAPVDMPRLLKVAQGEERHAVFARRKRRAEGLVFRIFYQLYKFLHWAMVGRGIHIGNFSALPAKHLERLVCTAEIWNHYAAATVQSKIPMTTVDCARHSRLHGESKMNFVSLVTHGLSALSVYGETVGTRVLTAVAAGCVLLTGAIGAVAAIRFGTDLAIPGWATYVTAFLIVILFQATTVGFLFTFVVLNNRSRLAALPSKVYQDYIQRVDTAS